MEAGILRVRWLGRAVYDDVLAVQQALARTGSGRHLLLCEHPPVYTLGVNGDAQHVLVDPGSVGAALRRADRGGDVTYHGPGQLVGYPVTGIPAGHHGVPAHVRAVEEVVIRALGHLGLAGTGRLDPYPGVWVEPDGRNPRKICAIGIRIRRGRAYHGFALNVTTDLGMFDHIVPCGIPDKGVTSLAAEGIDVSMRAVVGAVVDAAADMWGADGVERQDVAWPAQTGARALPGMAERAPVRSGGAERTPVPSGGAARMPSIRLRARVTEARVDGGSVLALEARKPPWVRAALRLSPGVQKVRATLRELGLVTVCEEAGCPNLSECWSDGTATFMINGSVCTRACSFCEVATGRPGRIDPEESRRVAEAVTRMGLAHAVVTAVARDDQPDGGAAAFAETIRAIRLAMPSTGIEVLIPDCKGDADALEIIFSARPDVLNHNVETVPRLQRSVRPSASYARSLGVLARAVHAGLVAKSGLIVGMGEEPEEVVGVLADLAAIGVSIVTIGQYLRPSGRQLPVARWWGEEELHELAREGRRLGIAEMVATPLTRSSYHAREAAESVAGVSSGASGASPGARAR